MPDHTLETLLVEHEELKSHIENQEASHQQTRKENEALKKEIRRVGSIGKGARYRR